MIRKILVTAVLMGYPILGWTSVFNCAIKQGEGNQRKEIWSGKISLNDGAEVAGKVLIIKKDGRAIALDEIKSLNSADIPVQKALKPYDGLLVVGLRRSGRSLDLNVGHVDARRTKDFAPMEVGSWASIETKEIGLLHHRIGVWVLCKVE